ncbi:hypothetical protein MARBORIA2_11870 [Methanobrevibacter arboriphilus]|jgi:transposase|uniref:Uncharacterized protein n=1 Tax=Methanobrevibacter arboriphilus TaxID=39441 RepID=A0ACA8R6H6_METAZ|nr:hypothetical protein [Methanobrevibacter arboriphilus]BBL63018.1 hypothetical protein MarbSA_20580 [Methanobrevibacter arboriphilus]GLI12097.1 hypothetical protein MARBORIA2_11870 [Methanobrevibacter arboriphilus]
MKICPRCGSKNVDWIIPQNWSVWECKDCDYTGPVIEGDEKIAKEIKEDYELKLKIEKSKSKKDKKNKEKTENQEKEYEETECEEELTDEEIERRLDELEI